MGLVFDFVTIIVEVTITGPVLRYDVLSDELLEGEPVVDKGRDHFSVVPMMSRLL